MTKKFCSLAVTALMASQISCSTKTAESHQVQQKINPLQIQTRASYSAEDLQDASFQARQALQHIEEAQNLFEMNENSEARSHVYKADVLLSELESDMPTMRLERSFRDIDSQLIVSRSSLVQIDWLPVYTNIAAYREIDSEKANQMQDYLDKSRMAFEKQKYTEARNELKGARDLIVLSSLELQIVDARERIKQSISLLDRADQASALNELQQIEDDLRLQVSILEAE